MHFGDEIRLAGLVFLNAAVFAAAYSAARRGSDDPVQRGIDTLLISFIVQYIAVCFPGVLHILSPATMALTALLLLGVLVVLSQRSACTTRKSTGATGGLPASAPRGKQPRAGKPPVAPGDPALSPASPTQIYLAAFLFAAGFLAGLISLQSLLPISDTDAMTYHVPAAVHWLQTGKLGFFPVWFFNPANTYSPLAGSTFIAWLLAPLGNDAVARFAQVPALLLLMLAMVQLCRALGLSPIGAGLIATATALSRPFISEVLLARDDVFLAAFFLVAVAGCASTAMRDRRGPWRIGIALGLGLATKYTAVFSLPIFLLLWDAPKQAGWSRRHWIGVAAPVFLLAGPWYLRNLLLTGNPLYPVRLTVFGHTLLPGILTPLRSEAFGRLDSFTRVFVGGYHNVSLLVSIPLLLGWFAWMFSIKTAWRSPLHRACVFGPPLCIALFVARSPYAEVRFLFPAFCLIFAAAGAAVDRPVLPQALRWGICAALLVLAVITSYTFAAIHLVGQAALWGLQFVIAGITLIWADRRLGHQPRARTYFALVLALGFSTWIYVEWNAFLIGYRATRQEFWKDRYPEYSTAWTYLDEKPPRGATIAYTNTYLVYPLQGFRLGQRAAYVPTRSDMETFLQLPPFPKPVRGEEINRVGGDLLRQNHNADQWLRRLKASGASYLFVSRKVPGDEATSSVPPEAEFAAGDPKHFVEVFRGGEVIIYQLQW